MPYLRASCARKPYRCAGCGADIRRGERYFRDEPHPRARVFRGAPVRHVCAVCVLGEKDAVEYLAPRQTQQDHNGQHRLPFGITPENLLFVPPRVHLVDITPNLLHQLARDPDLLQQLGPERFEELVFDRLRMMGFDLQRVGNGTYQRDGGIDAVAWPRSPCFPFLLAVQAKHTRSLDRKIGPAPVRELLGVLEATGFNAGMLVTNTTFTPSARWFAEQTPMLIQLRDNEDLRRWLRDEFLREYEWRGIPRSIEVCPGITVSLPP